jgi:hypothetical protein
MPELHENHNPRVAKILERGLYLFAGNQGAFQRWLDTPDPQLSDITPREMIGQGKPEVVAQLIEAALQGIPD